MNPYQNFFSVHETISLKSFLQLTDRFFFYCSRLNKGILHPVLGQISIYSQLGFVKASVRKIPSTDIQRTLEGRQSDVVEN